MYERRKEDTQFTAERVRKQVIDIRRCVDFLEGSQEYTGGRLVFIGYSYFARRGPIACSIDPRFEVAIYVNGGVKPGAVETVQDTVNFAPRATQPALMLNGIEDHIFPVNSSQKPMFELLGAPRDKKEYLLLGIGHNVEPTIIAEQVDRFLLKHIGGVQKSHFQLPWRKIAASHARRGDAALSANQSSKAENYYRQQLELFEEHGDQDDDETIAGIRFDLALSIELQGPEQREQSIRVYRDSLKKATLALGPQHSETTRTRNRLGYVLARVAVTAIESSSSSGDLGIDKAQAYLRESEQCLPGFAWSQVGLAIAAHRNGDIEKSIEHLRQCESRHSTWHDEFALRSILAAESKRYQESQDWLTVMKLEKTNRFHHGTGKSVSLFARATELIHGDPKKASRSTDSDAALERLVNQYSGHYYLHWLKGLQAIRAAKEIEPAHQLFRTAFEICPGYRTTDWYAITSQWLGDDDALQQCRTRLVELAVEKRGHDLWDQIHLARAYCRHSEADGYDADQVTILREKVDYAIRFFGDSAAMATAKRLLQYRQGQEVRIDSFTHNNNPEEQAESMIFNAITEYRFGDRAAAFSKLDTARAFIQAKFPSPDGPTYRFVGSDHGWFVSHLLLREANKLIELGSDDFDQHTAQAVGKLREELQKELGPSNAKAILLRVGQALVDQYSSAASLTDQG